MLPDRIHRRAPSRLYDLFSDASKYPIDGRSALSLRVTTAIFHRIDCALPPASGGVTDYSPI